MADNVPVVLIADNDAGISGMLAEVFRRSGLRVDTAPDGAAALDRLRLGGVDVLVCDLDMPRMSGEELIEEVCAWHAPPPIAVISGYVDAMLAGRLGQLEPVRCVLRKPFDVLEFARTVSAIARPGGTLDGSDKADEEVNRSDASTPLFELP